MRRVLSVLCQRPRGSRCRNKSKEKIFAYVAWHLGIGGLHHMVVMINTKDGKLHHRSYQIRHLCAIRSTAQYILD